MTWREGTEPTLPFLRWVGGKRCLVDQLVEYLPSSVKSLRYVEPFLGAGSLYFRLRPPAAILSDANPHLMGCYRAVRDRPRLVARYLARHQKRNSRSYYYKIRALYNRGGSSAAQAARFIYLNATCFNGIFRVNRRGSFNVPYNYKARPQLPSPRSLVLLSNLLKTARIFEGPYTSVFEGLGVGDFAYLDPPYPPLNGTAFFTHYTMDRFSYLDHETLAERVGQINRAGALFMMTNADTPQIRRFYRSFRIRPISVTRYVTCKAVRHKVSELLITNYD